VVTISSAGATAMPLVAMKALSARLQRLITFGRAVCSNAGLLLAPWWPPTECLRQTSQGRETTGEADDSEPASNEQLANGGGFDVLKAAGKCSGMVGFLKSEIERKKPSAPAVSRGV
jgi:hypothetical protein